MISRQKKLHVLIAYNEPQKKSSGDIDFISEAAVKDEADMVYHVILKMGHVPHYLPVKNLAQTIEKIEELKPDLIFNLCEGFQGNAHLEMNISGLWDLLAIPYTGNSPITLGLAQDKVLAKSLFQANDIPTPAFQVFDKTPEATDLKYPLIAKPSQEDASLGITHHDSVCNNFEELISRVDLLLAKYQQPILVEEFIQGREFNIGILGNNPPQVLPISEIVFDALDKEAAHITSYEAKWLPDDPLYQKTPSVCPAKISPDLKNRLEKVALKVYQTLKGRDYGRVDTRVNSDNQIFVLEYNPNPDISPDAGFVKSLKAGGILYKDFINLIINQSLSREVYGSHSQNEK